MADLPLGNVPLSTIEDSDNIIFTEGQYAKKIAYSDVKTDMLGSANLVTTAPKTKGAINELVQDLLESTGYGIVNGGVVSAQSTPNMTVQATGCTLKTATGARQVVAANPTLTVTTADTTNPRKDIVYIDSTGVVQYLQGTAAASPTAPSTPTGGSLLAEIYVAANATTITNANITDKRKLLISTDWLNSQLSQRVKKSSVAITYYISTTGNDTNDGLTSGTAFKTIQHAIDILPQVVNHVVVINILSGTYNEAVNLYGYSGYGSITIKGGINLATAVNYLVTNVNVKNCSCAINITGITATITTANAFTSYANVSCIFVYCNTTVSALSYNGFYITSSLCYINGCNVSNRYNGITADYMSTVCSNANTGSGNTTGLYSILGSTIAKNGTQPSATTAETTTSGGVIR